ncbi:hypothetical protein SCOR_11620 [Sulfidibacter corallicola]|uniref:Uncharacterized protein n=1 Tax=Sulfidibacter corallicola TaxID=2818388 RepID=A0A8A4TDL4_SULCO|nr:hypothetical protein [Sulfidibacter corallicola]QTD48016.1 hypothetical protein J3U87_20730 [Sulfidibacter corallicola]
MSNVEKATEIVYAAIDEVNNMLAEKQRIPKDPSIVLYGQNAVIPSLMLMNLVVAVEEVSEDEHEAEISITKVFHSVKDLIDQVKDLLDEEG